MVGEFAEFKREMRRVVHDTFAVRARWRAPHDSLWIELGVRYHNKKIVGDQEIDGYATRLDTVDSLVFDGEELAAKNVLLQSQQLVVLTDYNEAVYRLERLKEIDGPVNVEWEVTRVKGVPR